METKFTKGPLVVDQRDYGNYYVRQADAPARSEQSAIATFGVYEQSRADATLYAAAPDLYAACSEIIMAAIPSGQGHALVSESSLAAARAALAKARGE